MKNPATILFQVESPEIADKDIISQNHAEVEELQDLAKTEKPANEFEIMKD